MTINRRSFIKKTSITGAALVIGVHFNACKKDQPEEIGEINLIKGNIDNEGYGISMNPFLIIDPNGAITLMASKPEMGQGTFQSIPLIIAEELDVNLDRITTKISKGDEEKFGRQGVGGSGSVKNSWIPMRQLGAGARQMLRQAAAEKWGIKLEETTTDDGFVLNQKGEKLGYGELVEAASKLEVPKEPKLKELSEFKYIGKNNTRRKDIDMKVDGTANFGIDMRVEGMVYATVLHCPGFSGTIESIDDTDAKAIPGVIDVVKTVRPIGKTAKQEAVAIIADNHWAALQGKKALQVKWANNNNTPTTTELFDKMRSLRNQDGKVYHKNGDFDKAFNAKEEFLEASYEMPFLAHSPMEPQNCLADVKGDKVEIWAPTQTPNWSKKEVASFLDVKPEDVTMNISFLGGGFGRRLLMDVMLTACDLSKKVGKPVRLLWTREDDTQEGPFRPASVNKLRGALNEDGTIAAIEHKVVTPSIMSYLFGADSQNEIPKSAMAPLNEYYDLPNYRASYIYTKVDPVPLLWWRSVYSSTNVFAHESFIDELAVAAKKDPMEFRLDLLKKDERKHKLLETLRAQSNWDQPLPDNWGKGIAISHCFESTAAHVVYVSKQGKGVKIEKIFNAVDVGIMVNPDNVKAQAEGCIVMGLTAAIKDPIQFEDGKVVNTNFHNYQMLRIDETPEMDIHLMENAEAPTGAGEPGLPPIAPALTNAIFNLTGKRIRRLPFDINDIKDEGHLS